MKLSAILKKQMDEIQAKITAAFSAMMENFSEDQQKEWESLIKVHEGLEKKYQDALQKETMEEGHSDDEAEQQLEDTRRNRRDELDEETRTFVTNLRESITGGGRFQSVLPLSVASQVQMKKNQIAKLRGLCTNHIATGEYTFYAEGDDLSVAYTEPGASIGASEAGIDGIALSALKLAGITKVNNELMADLTIDLVDYIVNKFAKAFAKMEDHEIVYGAGTSGSKTKIRGIVTNIGENAVTTAKAATFTWAELKKVFAKVAAYRGNATIVCSPSALDIIQEFKDGDKYMFDQGKTIESIRGMKVVVSETMDAVTNGKTPLIVGDFSYYHICDRQEMIAVVLHEKYADTDQTGVKVTERIDGDLVPAAFASLKMGAGA